MSPVDDTRTEVSISKARIHRLLAAIVLVLTIAACATDSVDVPETASTTESERVTDTTTTSTTEAVTTPTTVPEEVSLTSWLGSYSWVEFVEGDPGSDQTLVHELMLREATASGLIGTLSQNGFQTFVELSVEARPAGQAVEISVLSVDDGFSSYSPGDVLFRLGGVADAPVTIIEGLATLTQPTDPGRYFQPGVASVDERDVGGSIWAVDAATYDLVLVDLETGDILDTVAGWGAEFADPDEGSPQVLQTLEVDARGRVWVDDCCEPAFGSTFGIDPAAATSIQEAQIRLTGLTPRVTPSGDLVAVAIGDLGVAVFDTGTGQMVADPAVVYSLVTDAEYAFLAPIAWANDVTLAVAAPGDSTFTVSFVDLTDPSAPELLGTSDAIEGAMLDGDFRDDGTVAVLVSPELGSPERRMVALDPLVVETVEVIELPDGTVGIDFDTAGRNLLLVTADGALQPFGGEAVQIGPFIDAAR